MKLGITIRFEGSKLLISKILDMNVDIVLHGRDNGKIFYNAWHFDFHSTKGDEVFTHPMYHCQNGGKNLRNSPNTSNLDIETGEVILIESPRIMHPPMDPVLAVDFVIGNFLGNDIVRLLHQNRFFKAAITDSIESLWKPYYEIMFKYFDQSQSGQNRALAAKLNPTLLP